VALWDQMGCSLVEGHQLFRRSNCFHLLGRFKFSTLKMDFGVGYQYFGGT
jgi:hypothetical protein